MNIGSVLISFGINWYQSRHFDFCSPMPGTRSGNSYNPNQGLREPDLTAYQGCMSSQELQDSPSTVPQVQPAPKTVDSILTHQFVSTRRGGYYKFLVKWASKPKSEADWLQGSEVHHLNPQLYTDYVEHYLPEASYWGREEIDANEKDQDSSKEQCVTAATDFAEARGLKYFVLAKIPTMHVNVNVPAKHVDKEAVN